MQARCTLKFYGGALWVQQAHPHTVFNWQFWERAAHDPKMTSYLAHGVKAKMCETTPFVNSVGTQYIASRAQIERACDSLRQKGSSMRKAIGLTKVDLCTPTTEAESAPRAMVEALMVPPDALWSTHGDVHSTVSLQIYCNMSVPIMRSYSLVNPTDQGMPSMEAYASTGT